MEDNFYKDEFERFIEEQANNHRMFASDSVWQNIYHRLHGDNAWPALTIAGFAFLAAVIAISVYFTPGPNLFERQTASGKIIAANEKSGLINSLSQKNDVSWSYNQNKKATTAAVDDDRTMQTSATIKHMSAVTAKIISDNAFRHLITKETVADNFAKEQPAQFAAEATSASEKYQTAKQNEYPELHKKLPNQPTELKEVAHINGELNKKTLKEKNVVSVKAKNYLNRFSYTVYITPSMSFRRLSEDELLQQQKYYNIDGPVALNFTTDVNRIVRHAPGTGLEAGVAFGYRLNDKLKVTSALQFNVRQYFIEAYVAESEVATIVLQSNSGYDSISRSSVYRTSTGFTSTQLINRFYQVSLPAGFEWTVFDRKNIGLNLAATVQPTYNLNKNSYLLTTNFKNYTESNGILRNWNINTSVGAFLNFKRGTYQWQLGPQFKYQQLPTYTKKYPIKEHLMDYGFKIGVSKSIQ